MPVKQNTNGAIAGCTIYSDGTIVGENCNVTLPEVNAQTVEIIAGGTTDLPITTWFDAMECTINMLGIDEGLHRLCRMETQTIEVRAAQDQVDLNGTKSTVGVKAFMRGTPKNVPSFSINPGEISENEVTIAVTRYELLYNNRRMLLIDKMKNIYEVNGIDYGKNINHLL